MTSSNAGKTLGPYANIWTATPMQGKAPPNGMHPPRIHRATLLHRFLPRATPLSSSSSSPSADPSLSQRDVSVDGGGTSSHRTPTTPATRPQSQSQTQPEPDLPASSQAQVQTLTPLPLAVMPDSNKLGTTTRLLLQDTQAHMEKFAARMDALGAHVEQSLREIQMCRTATEGASQKCVSEVVDVVYKCQSNFIKKLEANNDAVQKQGDAIDRLRTDYDRLIKLYESHTSMYASQATAIQEVQKQQVLLIQGITPLEPLVKCISPQTENVVLGLGARLSEDLQKSRDAIERQAVSFEDSSSKLCTVEKRLNRVEDQLADVLVLLQRLSNKPSATPQKTPVQSHRKRHNPDRSPFSPQAKRQRIYPDNTHRNPATESSDLFRQGEEGSGPLYSSSTLSSMPDNSGNSLPLRLRATTNSTRGTTGRRATIAPALRVSPVSKRSDSTTGKHSHRHTIPPREVSALSEPYFANPTLATDESILPWSLRPRKSSAVPSDPLDEDLTLPLEAPADVFRTSSNSKRRETAKCQGKENDALSASSINGSHSKKINSKKSRRSTNAPDVSISLRSPIPSPFVPPPPPQTQTQTQTDASQTQTLVPSTGSMVLSTGTTHTPNADPSNAPTREVSFFLTFDSSQATSQTFTQVASQVQAKLSTVGNDTPVADGTEMKASSTAGQTQLPSSGADMSGKLAKQELTLAAALFPEANLLTANRPMFDSYGRPKRYLSLDPGEHDDDDGTVIDLLDEMMED
ncbi:hypothetical protein SCHPADRAFT_138537 [Schizopora paradoxa]|uniref:Uncharacterized protein n=1 Tax=Schizopora paradoxa TaxID=27342 RepID=A0A0H2S1R5_9AGAM|nr:hypothetical protein SCHPADRAFT_138537 [Schizopora paradoxa]